MNGERYCELPKMQELDLHDMWCQEEGATCYTASITMELLRGQLGEQFISRSGPVIWSAR